MMYKITNIGGTCAMYGGVTFQPGVSHKLKLKKLVESPAFKVVPIDEIIVKEEIVGAKPRKKACEVN